MYNFWSLSNKSPTIFWRLIFQKKRKPKIFGLKNWMERGIRKCLTFVIRQIASKIFGKKNTQALKISKRLKFPSVDRTDRNFIAPLKVNFYSSKSTLDSLKSVCSVLKRKLSLGAWPRFLLYVYVLLPFTAFSQTIKLKQGSEMLSATLKV